MPRFECPKCDAEFKLKAAPTPGKSIRCPECDQAFKPDVEDDEAVSEKPLKASQRRDLDSGGERPRPKKEQPQKSNTLLFALLGGGAVALLLCCGFTGVMGYVYWPKKDIAADGAGGNKVADKNKNPNVTSANMQKVKSGMKRQEVEDVMGIAGENIDLQEANKLLNVKNPNKKRALSPEIVRMNGHSITVWRNGGNHFLVAFVPSKKYGELAAFSDLHIDEGGGNTVGGGMFATPSALEKSRDEVESQLKLHNDPKWKKGQAKTLIVGTWGNANYFTEFKADGTMSLPAPFGFGGKERAVGTYKFLDDEHVQYDIPATKGLAADKSTHKVLVNENELVLIRRAEQPFGGGIGPEGRYFIVRPGDVRPRWAKN